MLEIFEITPEIETCLRRYASLLSEANRRARLTGPTDPDVLYCEHIADACSALPLLDDALNFIDVGTGGGLPGMVWGMCRPDLRGVLLDSIEKKCRLVEEMRVALQCTNIEVVNRRSEDYATTHREHFDVATARAVAKAGVIAEYLSPFVRVGGRIVAFKGPSVAEEIDMGGVKWSRLGLSQPELIPYATAGMARFLLVWNKIAPCPAKYPRKPGMAEKSPWWQPPEGRKNAARDR